MTWIGLLLTFVGAFIVAGVIVVAYKKFCNKVKEWHLIVISWLGLIIFFSGCDVLIGRDLTVSTVAKNVLYVVPLPLFMLIKWHYSDKDKQDMK